MSLIPVLSPDVLAGITRLQDSMLASCDCDIQTDHILHGGMYTRTIRLEKDYVLVGALIKVPTILVVNGATAVFTGDGWIELEGYHVIPARAGRKQVFVTRAETVITMSFRTDAKTIEQAEDEFTDESKLLVSRRQGERDTVTITGE